MKYAPQPKPRSRITAHFTLVLPFLVTGDTSVGYFKEEISEPAERGRGGRSVRLSYCHAAGNKGNGHIQEKKAVNSDCVDTVHFQFSYLQILFYRMPLLRGQNWVMGVISPSPLWVLKNFNKMALTHPLDAQHILFMLTKDRSYFRRDSAASSILRYGP